MKRILALLFICVATIGVAQQKKNLTLNEIVSIPEGINAPLPTVIKWEDNKNLLIRKRGDNTPYLYDVKKKTYTPTEMSVATTTTPSVSIKGAQNPTPSPDGTKIAFTRDNNLFIYDIASKSEKRLTSDGDELILNGWASWVYYEEILGRGSRYRAFWWSPDSEKIAFYRFDNSGVPMFPIYDSKGQNGSLSETRYPKAGQTNPTVKVGLIDLTSQTNNIVWADFNEKDDQYFGIPYWSGNSELFIIPWMPRDQNEMTIYKVDYKNGKKEGIYDEQQPTWIDWVSVASFTDEGMYMVRDFELWEQIYYLSYDGSRYEKLTEGKNWNISIIKRDEEAGLLFFTAQRDSRVRTDIYRLNLKTKEIDRISFGDYSFSGVRISPDNKHYVASYSNTATPTKLALVTLGKKKNEVEILGDSKGEKFDDYKLSLPKMLTLDTGDGFTLHAHVTYPVDMDSTKRYPVLFSIYGGPNSPQVRDGWRGISYGSQMWANQGVIQVTMDSRTAGQNGKAGMNEAYQQLGVTGVKDFVMWAKYFKSKPYVDHDKIGIKGFSFGGTMSAYAVMAENEHFKYGIAGGGVYDWALYDTHYGERYMDTPQDNKDGYDRSRVTDMTKNYKGDKTNMLKITHGTSDDNVHLQNSMQLVDALQKDGKMFELMLYPGAFHGYRGYHGTHASKSDLIFWYRYLLNSEPPKEFLR